MSAEPQDLEARIAGIDRTRSRLGVVALLCAVGAVGMAALGMAAVNPGRFIAFALLAVGGLMIVMRLRLAWQRVQLARAALEADAARRLRDGNTLS